MVLGAAVIAGAFVAGVLAGITGFGFNLLTVPILALAIEPRAAVIVSLLAGVAVSGWLLTSTETRSQVDVRLTAGLFACSLLGLPIGALLLANAGPAVLKTSIGLITVAYSLPLLLSKKGWPTPPRYVAAPAAVVSGILSASTGLSGPPVILFLQSQQVSAARMRATLGAYFFLVTLATVGVLAIAGLISRESLLYSLPIIPVSVFGVDLGRRVFSKISGQTFSGLVIVLLLTMGLLNVLGALPFRR